MLYLSLENLQEQKMWRQIQGPLVKFQTIQNHGLDGLAIRNDLFSWVFGQNPVNPLDDAQLVHHRRHQAQVMEHPGAVLRRSHRTGFNMRRHHPSRGNPHWTARIQHQFNHSL